MPLFKGNVDKPLDLNKPLNLNKPMQTRDGRIVRYLGERKAPNGRMFVFAIPTKLVSPYEHVSCRFPDGTLDRGIACESDIINVVERVVRYVNIETDKLLGADDKVGIEVKAIARTVDRSYPTVYSALKLTFEDGVLVDSEVIR